MPRSNPITESDEVGRLFLSDVAVVVVVVVVGDFRSSYKESSLLIPSQYEAVVVDECWGSQLINFMLDSVKNKSRLDIMLID